MELRNLGDTLLKAGAPVLKSVIEQSIGGIGGKLAGAAIDALAEGLGTQPTPEAIDTAIRANPNGAAQVVRTIESEFKTDMARIAEANRDVMRGYQEVLLNDAKTEGWLAQRWRPIFALAFTVTFVMIAVTVCRGIWIGQLEGVEAVTGLLITMLAAGCAVLGVQIWQRSEEKKAGVV
jgi:hypothetical protein